jgi:hypothetical protein
VTVSTRRAVDTLGTVSSPIFLVKVIGVEGASPAVRSGLDYLESYSLK